MAIEIKVPPLGESISEAVIANLKVKEGDFVNADQLIAELETDKVTLEINAPSAGKITKLNVKVGDTVAVGAVIGSVDGSATGGASAPSNSEAKSEIKTVASLAPSANKQEVIMSPAASKMAAENNVNISSGSGKDGRVTKGDVINSINNPSQPTSAPKDKASRQERVKLSKLRQKIAQRLKESQNTAAILTTFNEVDMTNVMALRSEYKDVFQEKHGAKLGFMSFFVKAAIKALKEIPAVNAEFGGEEIIYNNFYDIGVAVGGAQGLVVPVIRDADKMSFADIENAIVNYGKKARDGKLTVDDMTGGTFTISNGGVYGSLLSTPIINPPQTGILGLHKIQDRPMVVNNQIVIRPMMYLALSYDHRLIDGKDAVTFLVKIKEAIEDPRRLLLDL